MEAALALAKRLGWRVRHEYMGEVGGGACELGGRKIIFLDLALGPLEQFEQLIGALRSDALTYTEAVPQCLHEVLSIARRRAA
jgi:hypothetical protein